MNMSQRQPKDQTKAAGPVKAKTDTSGMGRTPDSKPLTEQDLDAVVGGAKTKKTKFPYVYR
jgi:hypothetical protein